MDGTTMAALCYPPPSMTAKGKILLTSKTFCYEGKLSFRNADDPFIMRFVRGNQKWL